MHEPAKDIPAGLNRLHRRGHRRLVPRRVRRSTSSRLADGHRVTVFEQNVERATKAELWTAGEHVLLAWSPDHIFVVEEVDRGRPRR